MYRHAYRHGESRVRSVRTLVERVRAASLAFRQPGAVRTIAGVDDEPLQSGRYPWGYRSTQPLDTSGLSYHEAIAQAWRLFNSNPLAQRIITVRVDHILPPKPRPIASDPRVQSVLDRFWDDPVNDMDTFCRQAATQLLVFGTQVFPTFTSLTLAESGGMIGSGLVRLGYTDPADVLDIHLDPDNPRIPLWVETKLPADPNDRLAGEAINSKRRRLRVAHTDLDPSSRHYGLTLSTLPGPGGKHLDETGQAFDGGCLLFRLNQPMNGRYGWSDLTTLAKWLNQAEWFFTDLTQYVYFLTNFVWDVEITGATEAQLDARRAQIRTSPPSRGSILVHSDREKWAASTPDLRQEDFSAASRTLVWWIAGIGAGIPEHWLGWGRETTRATAREMQAPTLHMLQTRQIAVRNMLEQICLFQVHQAIRAHLLPQDVDTSLTLNLPDLVPPNTLETATTLEVVARALSTLITKEMIPTEKAAALLQLITDQLTTDLTAAGSSEK